LRLTPATLISGHAFRKLTVILTFEAAVHGDEPPDIKDYEPSFSGFFDQDTIQIKNTRAFQASLAGPTPAGLTPQASATSTREESYNIVKKLEFTTKLVAAPARPFPNCVSWEVKAKNDRDGIGDWFQVAVLLQRPKGSQFNMKVKTHASIGSIARLRSLLTPGNLGDFNKGREEVIGPLGPAPEELSSQDIPETINATDLNTARDKLWPFFKFHATEQLEATILHQKTSAETVVESANAQEPQPKPHLSTSEPSTTPRNHGPSGWRTEGKSARLVSGMPNVSATGLKGKRS